MSVPHDETVGTKRFSRHLAVGSPGDAPPRWTARKARISSSGPPVCNWCPELEIRLRSGGMDRPGVGAIACDRLEDGVSSLGPDEGLWVGIVDLNECGDVGFEIMDAAMHAALDLLVGEESESAFDLVQPGDAARCEVEMIARTRASVAPSTARGVDAASAGQPGHGGRSKTDSDPPASSPAARSSSRRVMRSM